jgi:LuxR family maltose regulon positive regulatory protein
VATKADQVDEGKRVNGWRSGLIEKAEQPRLPQGVLGRARLADQLTGATRHRLTLLSAGPGWGKTIAAASWAASAAQEPVAWLSLDDFDNNPRSFWSHLMATLVASGAVLGPSRHLNPVSWDEDADECWVQLANLRAPVVLIIDDFQVISDGDVLEQFGRFITKLPPSPLRVVLLTHADPVLPLHELRARGEFTQIRAADLAFTPAETTELFTSNAFPLRPHQLHKIMGRTDGWPAGVRTAALSIDPQDVEPGIARFCSTDRGVGDYFLEEVLHAVSPADRDFLLKTSITKMISGDQADQLTGRSDGCRTLARLFESNIFIVQQGQTGWYCYQPLLRRLLTMSLPGSGTSLAPGINRGEAV